jgi:hypothetical protein
VSVPFRVVPIDPAARQSWDVLRAIAYALPGTVLVGADGQALRILDDGRVEPVLAGGHPRPGAAHATARPLP